MIIDRKRQKRVVMIRLENVCFAYEKEIALRYVDLHINRGDSIVIQGPNGCGKSTLIKLLNGIIFPSEGKYFYQGHEINEKALKNSQFAMVSSADGICVSECRCPAFLWKCGGGNCIWPGPDGAFGSGDKKKNRRLPALIWIGKTKR